MVEIFSNHSHVLCSGMFCEFPIHWKFGTVICGIIWESPSFPQLTPGFPPVRPCSGQRRQKIGAHRAVLSDPEACKNADFESYSKGD